MHKATVLLIGIAIAIVVVAMLLRSTEPEPAAASSTTTAPESTTLATTTTLEPTTTTTLGIGTVVCDLYESVAVIGAVASSDLVEASGLAVSRTSPDVLWSHNDSRGGATLYAFSATGDDLGGHDVPGAFALDWEDISAGPGADGHGAFLYVGDIGDNFGIRDGLATVYRVSDTDPTGLSGSFPDSVALTYRYPDGSHNAEALFVDPIEPALYLITKDPDQAFVYKGTLEPSEGPIDLQLVTTLFLGAEVSAADMSADGTTLAVRGYHEVWMWHRNNGVSITTMLEDKPCAAPSPDERQGEAISFAEDLGYWTVSEGSHPDIQTVPRTTK